MFKRTCENCEHKIVCDTMRKDMYQHIGMGCMEWEGWVDAKDEMPAEVPYTNYLTYTVGPSKIPYFSADWLNGDGRFFNDERFKVLKWYSKPLTKEKSHE